MVDRIISSISRRYILNLDARRTRFQYCDGLPIEKGSTIIADCAADAGANSLLTCTFRDTIEAFGPTTGDFWVEASAAKATTEENIIATVNGVAVPILLPGGGGIGEVENTDSPLTTLEKYGSQVTDKTFVWTIAMPSSGANSILIEDAMDNNAPNEWHSLDLSQEPRLFERATVSEGGDWAAGSTWEMVEPSNYTITPNADNTAFTFNLSSAKPLNAYQLTYYTKANGIAIPGDTFGNNATINGKAINSDAIEHRQMGGGGAEGVTVGRFSLAKIVVGLEDGTEIPAETVFTVAYTVNGTTTNVELDANGAVVTSPRFETGTVVSLEEINIPELEGYSWETPKFEIDGEVVNSITIGEDTAEVVLTNIATKDKKEEENPGEGGENPGEGGENPGEGGENPGENPGEGGENPGEGGENPGKTPTDKDPIDKKPVEKDPIKKGEIPKTDGQTALAKTGGQSATVAGILAAISAIVGSAILISRRKVA